MHPSPPLTPAAARRRAILLIVAAAALFSVAGACVKGLRDGLPLAEVVLGRNLCAVPVLVWLMRKEGGLRALATRHPGLHLIRMLGGLIGMAGTFYGYAHLPLATVTALGFTMPLFLTLLAVPLLGERVGPRRGAAVLIGLLAAALGWAVAMITIRRMGAAGESNAAIVLWFALGAALVSALFCIPVWQWPTAAQWALLAATGVISALAQVMVTEAYRRGEASLLAPFEYSAILWTSLLGGVLWGELPDGWDLLGIAVLVGSGLYIWHREVTLGLKR